MKILGNRGMSLVEVMIAAGLLGVISLGVMKISEQQTVVQTKAESSFEINAISNLISQSLLNSDSCNNTLGVGAAVSNGASISTVKSRNNTVLFNTTNQYGNNKIKINSMTLTDLVISGAGPKYGEVNLRVEFNKLSKVITGNRIIIKNFPLKLELDGSNKLVKCYSATENAIFNAKTQSCASLGGVFNASTDKCNLADYATATITSSNAVSTKYLSDYENLMLKPAYVNVGGDTMTGKLSVNADIESSSKICVSGRCRTFSTSPCPTGKVVRTIKDDGTVVCANVTCPDPSTFFVGINASGSPICKAFPTNTCSANQYVAKVNADGSVVCANLPPGTNKDCSPGSIQRIDANGNHYCTGALTKTGISCPSKSYMKGIDTSGNPICAKLNISSRIDTTNTNAATKLSNNTAGEATAFCPSGYRVDYCEAHNYLTNGKGFDLVKLESNGYFCRAKAFNGTGSDDYIYVDVNCYKFTQNITETIL